MGGGRDSIYRDLITEDIMSQYQWHMLVRRYRTNPDAVEQEFQGQLRKLARRKKKPSIDVNAVRRSMLLQKLVQRVAGSVQITKEEYNKALAQASRGRGRSMSRQQVYATVLREKKAKALTQWWARELQRAKVAIIDPRFRTATARLATPPGLELVR